MRIEAIMDGNVVTITKGADIITKTFEEKFLAYCHILDIRDKHIKVGYKEIYFDFDKGGTIKVVLEKEDEASEEIKLVIEQTPVKKKHNVVFRLLAWVAHLFGHYKEV